MTDAEGLTTTYTYDALGRVIAETKSGGGFRPDTVTATVSYADGRTKETRLNGVVKTAHEYGPNWTKTYEGPAGIASPRCGAIYNQRMPPRR